MKIRFGIRSQPKGENRRSSFGLMQMPIFCLQSGNSPLLDNGNPQPGRYSPSLKMVTASLQNGKQRKMGRSSKEPSTILLPESSTKERAVATAFLCRQGGALLRRALYIFPKTDLISTFTRVRNKLYSSLN